MSTIRNNDEKSTRKSCTECRFHDFSVFKNCPPGVLEDAFSNRSMRSYAKGDVLMSQGDAFSGVYCIQEGMVKVTRIGNKNKEFILWFAHPGDIIGMDSFMSNDSYSFSSTALEPVSACFIPASDFKNLLTRDPLLSIGLMKDMCDKINFIEERITSIARKKIKEHFAEMLISLAVKNKKLPGGDIPVNCSVKDLADIIGTTKHYLYKILSDFSDKKVISVRNRKLVIRNMDKLSMIAVGDEPLV